MYPPIQLAILSSEANQYRKVKYLFSGSGVDLFKEVANFYHISVEVPLCGRVLLVRDITLVCDKIL